MEENQITERKRGGCLNAFLIVFLIVQGISIIMSIVKLISGDSESDLAIYELANMTPPSTASKVIAIVLTVIMFVGLLLVYKWKKMGVYMYIGANVVSLIVTIINAGTTFTIISGVAGVAIGVGIFLILIRNVFKYMD